MEIKILLIVSLFYCLKYVEGSSANDITSDFFGHTIYIESQYYYGWWIGATNHYNGHIYQLSEKSVFDPENPCRIEVIDCDHGWACLRTRYMEDTWINHSGNVTLPSVMGDPRSYFLEAGRFDVDWSFDTAQPEHKEDWFKWKIKCTSKTDDSSICYIENKYYEGAQLFAHYDNSLDTKYRKNGDDDSWFRHRIITPQFNQLSQEGQVIHNTCNHADSPLEVNFTVFHGISVSAGFGMTVSASVSQEVKMSVELAAEGSETISAAWSSELNSASTWTEQTNTTRTQMVNPGKQLKIRQLKGEYSTGTNNPYSITASDYVIYETDCERVGNP